MKKTSLSGEQVGSEENTNSSQSGTNIKLIKGTPFASVEKSKGVFVVIFGKHMISEKTFSSHEHASKWANTYDWATILNVVGIYVEHVLNSPKSNQL